jgi:hypothetical protein
MIDPDRQAHSAGHAWGGPFIVDAHGHNPLTAPDLRGEHIQRKHKGTCSTISDGLREARCPHLGGGTDRTCKGVFRNACPPVIDEDARNKINGTISNIVIQAGHLSRDERSLAGCDHLADTKMLNASTAISPETPPFSRACYPIGLVRSCGSR